MTINTKAAAVILLAVSVLFSSLEALAIENRKASGKSGLSRAQRQGTQHNVARQTDLTAKNSASGSLIDLPAWHALPDTSISAATPDYLTVSSPKTFWAGVIAYPDVPCDYRFEADGRLQTGSGYALAVRATVTDGHTPHGQGIQYDRGMSGFRNVLLPEESESGSVIAAQTDSAWHHIYVEVVGNHYESSIDGKVVFSGSTPTNCGNGVLIRVWRSTAEFRNISVTPIVESQSKNKKSDVLDLQG